MIRCAITGVGIWMSGVANAAAYAAGARDPEAERPPNAAIDRRAKRRASLFMRALAEVWSEAIAASGADPAATPTIFGSALGEAETMIKLLGQMWREGEEVSPMLFALSVHNAASGMVSISAKNRGFTTSLSADYDTPAMALCEGVGLVRATGGPVVVVCGDEASPVDLVPEDERFELLTAALVLAPADAEGALCHVRVPIRAEATLEPPVGGSLRLNPQKGLLDLVDCVLHRRVGVLPLDIGRGAGWCAELSR